MNSLVTWVVKQGFLAVRLSLPWIARVFLFTVMLVLISISSVWWGIPGTVDKIANDWLRRANAGGFPSQWENPLYYIFCVVAFFTILAGWIVISFATVFIVKWIF